MVVKLTRKLPNNLTPRALDEVIGSLPTAALLINLMVVVFCSAQRVGVSVDKFAYVTCM
jgi:hypothetical protein